MIFTKEAKNYWLLVARPGSNDEYFGGRVDFFDFSWP